MNESILNKNTLDSKPNKRYDSNLPRINLSKDLKYEHIYDNVNELQIDPNNKKYHKTISPVSSLVSSRISSLPSSIISSVDQNDASMRS